MALAGVERSRPSLTATASGISRQHPARTEQSHISPLEEAVLREGGGEWRFTKSAMRSTAIETADDFPIRLAHDLGIAYGTLSRLPIIPTMVNPAWA